MVRVLLRRSLVFLFVCVFLLLFFNIQWLQVDSDVSYGGVVR